MHAIQGVQVQVAGTGHGGIDNNAVSGIGGDVLIDIDDTVKEQVRAGPEQHRIIDVCRAKRINLNHASIGITNSDLRETINEVVGEIACEQLHGTSRTGNANGAACGSRSKQQGAGALETVIGGNREFVAVDRDVTGRCRDGAAGMGANV